MSQQSGPFRELWESIHQWDDHVPTFAGGPIRFAAEIGLLSSPALLAHVNYCDDDEMNLLANGQASVVYCPRTHEYFGHPPHRFAEMMAAGINVAIGTDSCASSPDLNVLEDLRLAYRINKSTGRKIPATTLWKMITISAARALGNADMIGSIAPGKCADFTWFEVEDSNDPLQDILESKTSRVSSMIDGVQR